jgi:hypothetical protein
MVELSELFQILQLVSPLSDKITRREFDLLDFIFRGGRDFAESEELLSSSTPFWQYSKREDKSYQKKDIAVRFFRYFPGKFCENSQKN